MIKYYNNGRTKILNIYEITLLYFIDRFDVVENTCENNGHNCIPI